MMERVKPAVRYGGAGGAGRKFIFLHPPPPPPPPSPPAGGARWNMLIRRLPVPTSTPTARRSTIILIRR